MSCPEIITKSGRLFKGRQIQTQFKAYHVNADFYKNRRDMQWVTHEAEQQLRRHHMVRLIDAPGRTITVDRITTQYVPVSQHSWLTANTRDLVGLNPPPTTARVSQNWDTDPDGLASDPTVYLKVKIGLRMDLNHAKEESDHICKSTPHPLSKELFQDLHWEDSLDLAIIPPPHNLECQNCVRRAYQMVRQALEAAKGENNKDIELGIYKSRRPNQNTRHLSKATTSLWTEAELQGWTLDNIPRSFKDRSTDPIPKGMFHKLHKDDRLAFVYRVFPNEVSHCTTEESKLPVILRLSPTHAKLERGIEKYSQVIGERPWQIVSNARNRNRARDMPDNRLRKIHVVKHLKTGETLEKFTKKVSPTEPQELVASPQEEDTNQVTYADIVKTALIPTPDETGLTSTQV